MATLSLSRELKVEVGELLNHLVSSNTKDRADITLNKIVSLVEKALCKQRICPQNGCPLKSNCGRNNFSALDEKALRDAHLEAKGIVSDALQGVFKDYGRSGPLESQARSLVKSGIENALYELSSERKSNAPKVCLFANGKEPPTSNGTEYFNPNRGADKEGIQEGFSQEKNNEKETNRVFALRRSVKRAVPLFLSSDVNTAAVMTIFDKMNSRESSLEKSTDRGPSGSHREHSGKQRTAITERTSQSHHNPEEDRLGDCNREFDTFDKAVCFTEDNVAINSYDGNDRETNRTYTCRRDIRFVLPKFTGKQHATSALMTIFDKLSDGIEQTCQISNNLGAARGDGEHLKVTGQFRSLITNENVILENQPPRPTSGAQQVKKEVKFMETHGNSEKLEFLYNDEQSCFKSNNTDVALSVREEVRETEYIFL